MGYCTYNWTSSVLILFFSIPFLSFWHVFISIMALFCQMQNCFRFLLRFSGQVTVAWREQWAGDGSFPVPNPELCGLWEIPQPPLEPPGGAVYTLIKWLTLLKLLQGGDMKICTHILHSFSTYFNTISKPFWGLELRLGARHAHVHYITGKSQPSYNENVTNDKYLKGCLFLYLLPWPLSIWILFYILCGLPLLFHSHAVPQSKKHCNSSTIAAVL